MQIRMEVIPEKNPENSKFILKQNECQNSDSYQIKMSWKLNVIKYLFMIKLGFYYFRNKEDYSLENY